MAKSIAVTEQCPMEIGLNVLSGKWKLKILWQISKGAVRFNELQRRLVHRCTNSRVNSTRYPRHLHACEASRRSHYAVASQTHS